MALISIVMLRVKMKRYFFCKFEAQCKVLGWSKECDYLNQIFTVSERVLDSFNNSCTMGPCCKRHA